MKISDEHRAALKWFNDRTGQVVPWPERLNGVYLANRAKGIQKPEGWDCALSIRLSLESPYKDEIQLAPNGDWTMSYAYEGSNPEYFTNRGLKTCKEGGIPIGVLVQVEARPRSLYKVLGLGYVIGDDAQTRRFKISNRAR